MGHFDNHPRRVYWVVCWGLLGSVFWGFGVLLGRGVQGLSLGFRV